MICYVTTRIILKLERINVYSLEYILKIEQENFYQLVEAGSVDLTSSALSDIDPSEDSNRAIIRACQREDLDVVKVLLRDERVGSLSAYLQCALGWERMDMYNILCRDLRVTVTETREAREKYRFMFR